VLDVCLTSSTNILYDPVPPEAEHEINWASAQDPSSTAHTHADRNRFSFGDHSCIDYLL
jgi:hypothetical protein